MLNIPALLAMFLLALAQWGHVWPGWDITPHFEESEPGDVLAFSGQEVETGWYAWTACDGSPAFPRHCWIGITPLFWTLTAEQQQRAITHEVGHALDLRHPPEWDKRPQVMADGPMTAIDKRRYLDRWGLHAVTVVGLACE